MASEFEYESVLCVKPDVNVYRIPPRASNRGYRAADWKLDAPDWTGRMRVTARGKVAYIKLEDKISGEDDHYLAHLPSLWWSEWSQQVIF
ncbi:adaptin ear-binding coat-associated protein 1-like [Arapaima gigas]